MDQGAPAMPDRRCFPTVEAGGVDWVRPRPLHSIAAMNAPAKFLVLLDDSLRALLFDSEQCLLGEVIEEDGFIVRSLLRTASECPVPPGQMLRAIVPPPSSQRLVRCFELS
jgi:hypothetical protein